jgi:topoisomerase-4 subunit A
MKTIKDRVKIINGHLKNIVQYALDWIDGIEAKVKALDPALKGKRRTKLEHFSKVDMKELNRETVELKYDKEKGYLGTAVEGPAALTVDTYDHVFVMRSSAVWMVTGVGEKEYVGEKAWYIAKADKESLSKIVFTIIYKDAANASAYIKRCSIPGWIMNKEYPLVPEGSTVLHVDTRPKFSFTLHYTPKPRQQVKAESFKAQDYSLRGMKAGGIRISNKDVESVEIMEK